MTEYKKPTKAQIKQGAYTPVVKTSTTKPKAWGKKHPGLPKLPKAK